MKETLEANCSYEVSTGSLHSSKYPDSTDIFWNYECSLLTWKQDEMQKGIWFLEATADALLLHQYLLWHSVRKHTLPETFTFLGT
jgi:hypothetical protein